MSDCSEAMLEGLGITPWVWLQVWDVATCACKHTLTHHGDKVQSVAWNSAQPSVLLSGGFDQAAFLVRCPAQSQASVMGRTSDPE